MCEEKKVCRISKPEISCTIKDTFNPLIYVISFDATALYYITHIPRLI